MPKRQPRVSAKDLVKLYLDLSGLRPDKGTWSEDGLADDPYGLRQYRNLFALFKAFEIGCKPADFHEGDWLDIHRPEYAPLVERIHQFAVERERADRDSIKYRHELVYLFQDLLKYRGRLHAVLDIHAGVLVSHIVFEYSAERIVKLNRMIRRNLRPIDELLEELISPDRVRFRIEDLARDYGYRPIDPYELAEWF
jgi:hypothetical protein